MAEIKPDWQDDADGAWIDDGAGRIHVFDPETGDMLAGLRRILEATANPDTVVRKGARHCGTACRKECRLQVKGVIHGFI